MQQAIPYRTWFPSPATATGGSAGHQSQPGDNTNSTNPSVTKMVSENAVIVFGRRGCCMCHVVKLLLQGHGVNPTIFEVDEQDEATIIDDLLRIIGVDEGQNDGRPQFPAVFVGGKLFGGLEKVMATHISGELVPILKAAGALWL
ncbi:unnamed protein product [Ilex paraguariensis]|uniref:Glutaredoxin domain-containing protein n=1 Tax=Ilex paraguariensis TaxID=185542 RepID=A0ABC8S5W2_9AQUA